MDVEAQDDGIMAKIIVSFVGGGDNEQMWARGRLSARQHEFSVSDLTHLLVSCAVLD